jgi:hypothetical protein
MFVRWATRGRVARRGEDQAPLLTAALVRSIRVGGKPRQRIVGYLGAIRLDGLGPEHVGYHGRIWDRITARLDALALSVDERAKVEAALAARIPRPSPKVREAQQQAVTTDVAKMNAIWRAGGWRSRRRARPSA